MHTLVLTAINLVNKFEMHRYDGKSNLKMGYVTLSTFICHPRTHITSYSSFIETMHPSHTIFEIL